MDESHSQLLEVLWDDGNYAVRLGELINLLGPIETSVTVEAMNFVNNLRADLEDVAVNIDILYSSDAENPDPTDDEYQTAKNNILDHLRPKIRME